jgi:imidazole glycerol-phosphate synthase subunit HisH
MKVTVFDYGAGNLHSLVKAIEGAEREIIVETDPVRAAQTDALILPGVGAFAPAAAALAPGLSLMRAALADGLPCLGICLGMQLMFDASAEGAGEGLGVFAGRVTRLNAERVPQIGWNTLDERRDKLFDASGLTTAYYANGFVCRATDESAVIAWSTHETDRFPAAVRSGGVVGAQFHPEKSSTPGLRFVRAWLNEVQR